MQPSLPLKKFILIILVILFFFSILFIGYMCPGKVCALNNRQPEPRYPTWNQLSLKHVIKDNMGKSINSLASNPFFGILSSSSYGSSASFNKLSFDEIFKDAFTFDIEGNDVIVFLHIQKTGGTSFGRHLVRDLDLKFPCECKKGRKRCKCVRPDSPQKLWLFSRYSTGWKCGLHADWTELTNCVDSAMDESEKTTTKRRYFYITLLRDPIARFMSEFRHVQRGATWKTSRHLCGGRTPSSDELPLCYDGLDWRDVSIEEFIDCPHNLAINRQTRMLADLTLVGCYNTSVLGKKERDIIMLASAKENLRRMAYFGLCEFQKVSQYLFESSFKLNFRHPFIQLNETHSSLALNDVEEKILQRIKELNSLDIQLYDYAKTLLMERFEKMKESDKDFTYSFSHMGVPYDKNDKNSEETPEMKLIRKVKMEKMRRKEGVPIDALISDIMNTN